MPSTPPGAAESPSTAAGLFVDVDSNVSLPRRRLRLRGELDLASVPLLTSTLDEQAAGCARLELDVSDLHFCDLVGLTALEQAQQRLRRRGCRLTLHGIPGQLRRLLDVDGLRSPLSTAITPAAANASLPNPRRVLTKLLAGRLRLR